MAALTEKQAKVLEYVKACGPVRSGSDGFALRALESKGLVLRHQFSEGQNKYCTWTVTPAGRSALEALAAADDDDEFTGLVCDLCGQWIDDGDDAREWSDDRGVTGRGGFVHQRCYAAAGGPK